MNEDFMETDFLTSVNNPYFYLTLIKKNFSEHSNIHEYA